MDRLRDIILMSSEHVGVDKEKGIILKRGYMDLVSLNCFHRDDDFVFFDQEFYQEDYPANAIIYRTVAIIYENNKVRNEILPVSFFWKRYGMEETLGLWQRMSAEFTDTLRHQRELRTFNQEHLRNYHVVVRNRNRMNTDISEVYYDLLRETCFDHLEGKKVYLFGSGKYADKFLAFYQEDYEICGILDNNSDKWGTLMEGIPIESPDRLKERKPEEYKVIVCIRNFRAVLDQLQQMGVTNIGIYDINYVYPCRQRRLLHKDIQAQGTAPKYHIGYVAGVFDLFHIGHLNMFRRAKEMCEYLIVGVVSDEQVRRNKHKEPFVPFEERIEMVRSCRYVDEANKIPIDYAGTVEAFQAYHFDAQFSGSDYVNDPWWLQQKEYLESQGAQLVFFPYTESTSSTMLQSAIRMAVAENKTNQ
jgi:cytidyltransferase-like protein